MVKITRFIKNMILFEYHSFMVGFYHTTLTGPCSIIKSGIHMNSMEKIMLEEGIINVIPFDYNFLDEEWVAKNRHIIASFK